MQWTWAKLVSTSHPSSRNRPLGRPAVVPVSRGCIVRPLAAALLCIAAAPAPVRASVPDVLEEVPVTPADLRVQPANNSPAIAVDPTEPAFVALAARLDNPDFGCSLHVSGDGGRSWVPAAPVPRLPAGARKCYAPEVAFDSNGVLYYLFVGLHGRGNQPMGAFITTSVDRAESFTPPRRVLGPLNYMVRMAIAPDTDRLHLVWLAASSDPPLGGLPAPPNPIMSAYSDDGGRTFSDPVRVSDEGRPLAVAPALAVGPGGAVHVVYYDLRDDRRDYSGLEGPTWPGEWSLVAASSADAGETFTDGVVVDDAVVPHERVMVIFTMAPPAVALDEGRVHVAWHDAAIGDADVWLRTWDGGSWSERIRLNDDPARNGTDQYLPRLSVAESGRLDAIFYDRRNDPANVFTDVYHARVGAGGVRAANLRVTEESFDSRIGTTYAIPSAEGLVEWGSRLALWSDDERVLAAWADTRNNVDSIQQDVFATQIRYPSPGPAALPWYGLAAVGLGLVALVLVARRRGRR